VKSTCALQEHCVNRGPDAQTEALISEVQEHDKAWAMPGGLESCLYQKLHLARKSLKLVFLPANRTDEFSASPFISMRWVSESLQRESVGVSITRSIRFVFRSY
jgi:hypothetical protein